MLNIDEDIATVRASRAGHTFHERWAARRALQLVFPKDGLFAIAVEGISSTETASPGARAEEVADLVLYYGRGDNFQTCERLETVQFKYKLREEAVARRIDKNQCSFSHSSRNLQLELSMYAFCCGLPGSINCSCNCRRYDHSSSTWLTNSGPLSTVTDAGNPRLSASRSSTVTTPLPGNDVSTSSARHAFVKSSTIFKQRSRRPSTKPSDTKSIDQLWLGANTFTCA